MIFHEFIKLLARDKRNLEDKSSRKRNQKFSKFYP